MKFLILGGFLGSGKTTLLMQLARYLTRGSQEEGPSQVMILENEVGNSGVDDKFLKNSGYQVQNLFGGCTCCTLGSELISSVEDIRNQYHPDLMILETTGLAYPGLIRDNLKNSIGQDSRICSVVDAQRWKRLKIPMGELFTGQIECADTVLLNKTDLVKEEELAEIEKDIRKINGAAALLRTSGIQETKEAVWREVLGLSAG